MQSIKLERLSNSGLIWLLAVLLALILLPLFGAALPLFTSPWFAITLFSTLIIVGIFIVTSERRHRVVGWILGIITLLSYWIGSVAETPFGPAVQSISAMLFCAYLAYHLFRTIAASRLVDLNVIFGAIAGYLLMGIIGGQACDLLEWALPGSYQLSGIVDDHDFLYYSFVTLTTLGYGDIVPLNRAAQSLAILLSASGQLYLTILIAILVGKYLSK